MLTVYFISKRKQKLKILHSIALKQINKHSINKQAAYNSINKQTISKKLNCYTQIHTYISDVALFTCNKTTYD